LSGHRQDIEGMADTALVEEEWELGRRNDRCLQPPGGEQPFALHLQISEFKFETLSR
jgi:hypothetical protein